MPDRILASRASLTSLAMRNIGVLFKNEPPGWTRLEPQSVSGDPSPGIEARVHDPLWLLARQWQLGEFHGEDVGSPFAVRVDMTTRELTGWSPNADVADSATQGLEPGQLLDDTTEREPPAADGPGLRIQAEAGQLFLVMLDDAGLGGLRDAVLADCPLAFPDPTQDLNPYDSELADLGRVLAGRAPDAEQIAERLAAGLAASPPTLPTWFAGVADQTAALAMAAEWFAWYRDEVAPAADGPADAWVDDRLEYRYRLRLTGGLGLRAPEFGGGRTDWYAYDAEHGASAAPGTPRSQVVHATPLRYAGMPAERYWQFEDGQVNFGALAAQPHDLARLLLVEFAVTYGNDWLAVPVDVPIGSLTTIGAVHYTTTFGETFAVAPADDAGRSGDFRLFEITAAEGPPLRALFVAPAAVATLEGAAREDVLFMRDDAAALAWAIERIVQGPTGDPRRRDREARPEPPKPPFAPGADLSYLLETDVPANWIPFLAVGADPAHFGAPVLRKGAIDRGGALTPPLGRLLHGSAPMVVRDEEVPREGLRVARLPRLARRADGTYARWIARRATVGRGEGASGLAFDSAIPRPPGPPPPGPPRPPTGPPPPGPPPPPPPPGPPPPPAPPPAPPAAPPPEDIKLDQALTEFKFR